MLTDQAGGTQLYPFLSLQVILPCMENLSILRKGGVISQQGRNWAVCWLLRCWGIWDSTSVNSGTSLCQGTLLWNGANFRGDGMRK